jgi:hypothetical protein
MVFCTRPTSKGLEWAVQFSPATVSRSIGPLRIWDSADVIRELVARTPTKMDSASKQAFELALTNGRGGIFLDLTPEQYASLHLTGTNVKAIRPS